MLIIIFSPFSLATLCRWRTSSLREPLLKVTATGSQIKCTATLKGQIRGTNMRPFIPSFDPGHCGTRLSRVFQMTLSLVILSSYSWSPKVFLAQNRYVIPQILPRKPLKAATQEDLIWCQKSSSTLPLDFRAPHRISKPEPGFPTKKSNFGCLYQQSHTFSPHLKEVWGWMNWFI